MVSCNDDISAPVPGVSTSQDNELPLSFKFSWPKEDITRAEVDNGIERFTNNDIIHILGTFRIRYLKDDAVNDEDFTEETITRYGALRYNGKEWEEVAGSELKWPAVALTGQFVAYYISESSGILTGENPTDRKSLSLLTDSTDPLFAESAVYNYGYAVELDFRHICAHLTLIDLEPMVADYYWFTTDGPINQQSQTILPFNNAFEISLAGINNSSGPSLNFSFCQMEDYQYTGSDASPHYYIVGKSQDSETADEAGNLMKISRVSYFLQPGFYEKFNLVYPASLSTVYPYLEYDYTKVPDNSGGVEITNTPPDLLANTPYTLTITKSPGITINSPTSPEGWDDSGEYFDVDVEEFLRAVYNQTEYWNENQVQILEKTATGTRLLHNVNFKNEVYNFSDGFQPNNQESSVFDGDFHYIHNLASPLLRYNYGTVKNLGIQDINISLVSYEADDPSNTDSDKNNLDMSRNGALCMWNRNNARIENVRIANVNLSVYIKSVDSEGQETHNIGGVVGSNTGYMEGVELSGNFLISVRGLNSTDSGLGDGNDYPVNASVLIGGITGQNAAEGYISNGSAYGNQLSFSIINTCQGYQGAYSIGGIAGESSGFISGVILPNLNLDSSGSRGITSYIGALAGKLETSGQAYLNSSNVSGTIRAGISSPYGSVSSVSYIGGISGTVNNVNVNDCRCSVSVYATQNALPNVLYGTGEAFGIIRKNDQDNYDYKNLIVYGNSYSYPRNPANPAEEETFTNYYGTFAGIAPLGQTWTSDYADKNITVRNWNGLGYIGFNMDNIKDQ